MSYEILIKILVIIFTTFLITISNCAPAALHSRHGRRLWLRDWLTRLPRGALRGADDRQQRQVREKERREAKEAETGPVAGIASILALFRRFQGEGDDADTSPLLNCALDVFLLRHR